MPPGAMGALAPYQRPVGVHMSIGTERQSISLLLNHNPNRGKAAIIPPQRTAVGAHAEVEDGLMTDLASHALRDQLDQLLSTARRVAESLELDTVLSSIVVDA